MKQTIAQFLDIKEFPFEIRDSNGNLIYREYSDGFWIKQEFDSSGNKLYYEDSDGFWYKQEFDSSGNLIYRESSDGYWVKWEFDSSGNVIYYENSDGVKKYYGPKPSCEDNSPYEIGKFYSSNSDPHSVNNVKYYHPMELLMGGFAENPDGFHEDTTRTFTYEEVKEMLRLQRILDYKEIDMGEWLNIMNY